MCKKDNHALNMNIVNIVAISIFSVFMKTQKSKMQRLPTKHHTTGAI